MRGGRGTDVRGQVVAHRGPFPGAAERHRGVSAGHIPARRSFTVHLSHVGRAAVLHTRSRGILDELKVSR